MLEEKRRSKVLECPLKDMMSLWQRSPDGAVSRSLPGDSSTVRAGVHLWEDALTT